MTKRAYDIVVFGATGYTGSLVVEYLRDHTPPGTKWAVAGRSQAKIESVLNRCGVQVPILIADSSNKDSLKKMCDSTTVVLSTVGPFALYGYPLCEACVQASTHYCDITGEPQFIKKVIDTLNDDAVRNNSLIVNCCGYDSVPSDLGNMMMLKYSSEKFPAVNVRRVTGYHMAQGGVSAGTINSILNLMENNLKTLKTLNNPHLFLPGGRSDTVAPSNWPIINYSRRLGAFDAPFIMAGINIKVVNRSNNLRGSRSQYTERMGPVGFFQGNIMAIFFSLLGLLMIPPVYWLAKKAATRMPEGPSREVRDNGWFKSIFVAELDNGMALQGVVRSRHGDPGYKETAKMLAEAALTLALHQNELSHKGGVLPPSIALGEVYIKRLTAAGFEFERN